MADPKPFPGVAEFLFGTPLYQRSSYVEEDEGLRELFVTNFKIDGHCPRCGKHSTFSRKRGGLNPHEWNGFVEGAWFINDISIACARDETHTIRFNLRAGNKVIQKVGQFPSFADIANDESKQYRTVLAQKDAEEFHKAIGLAAHGVGIGAYVYIRRIFERLIHDRFNDWKTAEGWSEDDFQKLRMAERIDLLKDHLPDFLVKNKKLYGILSLGIHELNEADCLGFFSVIRASTVFILEEDKRKKEQLAQRSLVEKEIERYVKPNKDDDEPAGESIKTAPQFIRRSPGKAPDNTPRQKKMIPGLESVGIVAHTAPRLNPFYHVTMPISVRDF